MKKNAYLTILTIVTVLCIIIGVGIRVIKASNWLKNTFSNTSITTDKSEVIKLDNFDSISLSAEIANIDISNGDSFTLEYEIGSNATLEYEVSDGTLTIKQKVKTKMFNNNEKYNIIITVPENTKLENVEIEANVGDIDLESLDTNFCYISADVGDIDLSDITFNTMEIDANVGDVNIKSKEDLSKSTIEVTNDIGDVSVNREKQGKEFSQKGSDNKKLTITSDVGEVKITY